MRRPRLRLFAGVLAVAALALIAGQAAAAISASGNAISAIALHQFSGEVATFSDTTPHQYTAAIDWGDGTATSNGTVSCANCPSATPQFSVQGSHTYAQPGSFSVSVLITDMIDQDTSVAHGTAQVAPTPAPSADFTVSPASPVTGQDLDFDGSRSSSPNGAIGKFEWSLDGSGSFSTACDGSNSHAHTGYPDPGSYAVTLRVTDSAGATSSVTHTVDIADGGASTASPPSAGCGAGTSAQLAPGLRGPPSVAVSAPGAFSYYDRAPASIAVSGTLKAPEGLSRFCITTGTSVPDTIPADCAQKSLVSHGAFKDVPASGFKPGLNHIVAWVRDSVGTVVKADVAITVATAASGVDLRADAMEVTQGIQKTTLSLANPQSYGGVGLAAGGETVVRFYADAPRVAKTSTTLVVKRVDAVLFGFRGGKSLPGGPLLAQEGSRDLKTGTGYSGEFDLPTARGDAAGGYTFTLPESWTHGSVRLVGIVNPPDLPPAIAECTSCYGNNDFEIDEVKFTPTRSFRIVSAKEIFVTSGGLAIAPAAEDVWSAARAVTPLGAGQLVTPPYGTTIDLGDITGDPDASKIAKAAVFDWAIWRDYYDPSPPDTYVGVHTDGIRGSTDSGVGSSFFTHTGTPKGSFGFYQKRLAQGSYERQLTSLRHELGHVIGHPHASRSCGGDSDGQIGEDWPDVEGSIAGVGLDRRGDPSGKFAYPLKVQFRAPAWRKDTIAGQFDDLMSYCAAEPNAWTSTVNWERELATLASGPAGAAAARKQAAGGQRARVAASAPALLVSGFAEAGGASARFTRVEPGPGGASPGAGGSPFHVIAAGAGGQVLADTPMVATPSHEDPGSVYTSLFAQVPATGTESLTIADGGQALATRTRSAHAPVVKLLSPKPGATVGRARTVDVRWSATDSDGDKLSARLEYSRDGARTWRPVLMAGSTGRAALPRSYLAVSRTARLRVRVNDGFNEGIAVSGRFRSLGAPPAVTITSPAPKTAIAAGATLYLAGTAFDDRGGLLAGRSLRWLAGKTLLGRGQSVAAAGLPAGTHRIVLAARDSAGRVGRASVTVRVKAAPPKFVALKRPKRVSRRARSVALRVASSVPAVLQVGSRRFALARDARRIAIPIRPGRRALSLRLALIAGRQVSHVTLVIPRR